MPTEEERIKARARSERWKQNNPERYAENQRRWRSEPENIKKNRAYQKEYRKALGSQEYRRNLWLRSSYGLSVEDYNLMLESQDGRCLICKRTGEESRSRSGRLAVDHNHATNDVRGLLCTNCNKALGQFQDSIEILLAAAAYLEAKGSYGPGKNNGGLKEEE